MSILLGKTTNSSPLRSALLKQTPHITVQFESGEEALLDTASPLTAARSRVIDALQQESQLVYAETDDQNVITELHIPIAARVAAINEDGEELAVEIHPSAAIYHLNKSNARYESLRTILETALANNEVVLLTASSPQYEIIDVRALPPLLNVRVPESPLLPTATEFESTDQFPIPWEQAVQLFNEIAQLSCTPCSSATPCIPFRYPADGCWIRAHLMAYFLVLKKKITPEKIWSFGSLKAHTVNDPNCTVGWGFHVAVTLPVAKGVIQKMVFDPSLFNEPVSFAAWANVQKLKQPNVTLIETDWEKWYRCQGSATPEEAENEMKVYRHRLDLMCAEHGSSPYPQCAWVLPAIEKN